MIYVIEFLIDDGRKLLRFFDMPQEAHKLYEAAINPLTGGATVKGAKGAFVEEAKMLVVPTDDRREAKAAVLEGRAQVVRDSVAERQDLLDSIEI